MVEGGRSGVWSLKRMHTVLVETFNVREST